MKLHPLAGRPAPESILVNIPRLISAYYIKQPDADIVSQSVSFGTSGHRGTSIKKSFNENHIHSITQAICDYREKNGINGPLFLGLDSHALSEPGFASAIEVLAANKVETFIQKKHGYTPTPVISHAIIQYNRRKNRKLADGVLITPSHNPPEDGGFKYNPPHGGPAEKSITNWIQFRANLLLKEKNHEIKRIPYEKAIHKGVIHAHDYVGPYVKDLKNVVDMEIIQDSGIRIGVDPMGGAASAYWEPICNEYGINIDIVNPLVDPTFRFMSVDKDGKIRMDCSSSYAMSGLIKMKNRFDIAFGNDPDADRHGIVTPSSGLMNPNHFLSVAVWYLFQNRPLWSKDLIVGKTLVSSSMIDRVAKYLGYCLSEVPVGFKWFVNGLMDGVYGFGGEESAGASFLRKDGSVWTTDKDGIIMNLLAAEITAKTGMDPGVHYQNLVKMFGEPIYERIDAPATSTQKQRLSTLSPDQVQTDYLAGDKIIAKISKAPGNDAEIGGLKVVTENGWFAARPSGTEEIYKIYAESFKNESHLKKIQLEAKEIIGKVFHSTGV